MARTAREIGAATEAVAARIRELRQAARLTLREVYEPAGIPKSSYVEIESGKVTIDVEQIYRISFAMGIRPERLFTDEKAELLLAFRSPHSLADGTP